MFRRSDNQTSDPVGQVSADVRRDDHLRGQVLVIVALGMVSLIAMVGLVIDGGNAWGRQRDTQNGADSVSMAGTGVIQHYLAQVDTVTPTDWSVACAVENAALANAVVIDAAEYTDFQGQALVPPVAVGACGDLDPGIGIPAGAQGVKATASETFDTFLMRIVGFTTLTTTANATAVVGTPSAIPGGALPMTFPISGSTCERTDPDGWTVQDNNNDDSTYELFEIIDENDATGQNLAILPLCDGGPGTVGWLDYGCGQNLKDSILTPCEAFIPIPAWVHAQTGNPNAYEAELRTYTGSQPGVPELADSVVALPVFDDTCTENPDAIDPSAPHDPTCEPLDVEFSWNGDNTYYHVPYWIGFKLDSVYMQGGDPECKAAPGQPVLETPDPPGKIGCIKGWFVDRYDSPGPIALGRINPGDQVRMAVTLID